LLSSHEFSENIGVLDVEGHWVDHWVMPLLFVSVEVVVRCITAITYNVRASHYPIFVIAVWGISIQIFLVLAHLHVFSFPLVFPHFFGSEGNLFELFLLFNFALIVLSISEVLLVKLLIKILSIIPLHILLSLLFCLPPLLASDLLLLQAGIDEFIF
jgi:hypothetical protein